MKRTEYNFIGTNDCKAIITVTGQSAMLTVINNNGEKIKNCIPYKSLQGAKLSLKTIGNKINVEWEEVNSNDE